MAQRLAHSHIEAAANMIGGLVIAQILLWLWGMAVAQALGLNLMFLVASYLRSFLIRRIFARFAKESGLI